jgi:hypothetical protein
VAETPWDIANVVMDVASFSANAAADNYVAAAVDAVGVGLDVAATLVPGAPGGASSAINAYRGGTAVGEVVARSVDELSQAASAADRGGLTAAGRALQKHGGREGSAFPPAKGNPASINNQGQDVVDDILMSPGATTTARNHARYGDVIEVRAPDGRGVRYDANGKLMGLLEP